MAPGMLTHVMKDQVPSWAPKIRRDGRNGRDELIGYRNHARGARCTRGGSGTTRFQVVDGCYGTTDFTSFHPADPWSRPAKVLAQLNGGRDRIWVIGRHRTGGETVDGCYGTTDFTSFHPADPWSRPAKVLAQLNGGRDRIWVIGRHRTRTMRGLDDLATAEKFDTRQERQTRRAVESPSQSSGPLRTLNRGQMQPKLLIYKHDTSTEHGRFALERVGIAVGRARSTYDLDHRDPPLFHLVKRGKRGG